MNNSKTLPSLRITERTNNTITQALKKLNSTQLNELTLQDYRRYCLEFISQKVLNGDELEKITQM